MEADLYYEPIFLSRCGKNKSLLRKIVSLSHGTEGPRVRNLGHQCRRMWQSLNTNKLKPILSKRN